MITPDIDSPAPTAQKTKLPVEILEEIDAIFDPPPGVDSNGWPQTDHYAYCLACKSWTPPNHPEAHDHKEGCPAERASSIWADRRSTTRLLEDIDFLLGLVYELSIDAHLRLGRTQPPGPTQTPTLQDGPLRVVERG